MYKVTKKCNSGDVKQFAYLVMYCAYLIGRPKRYNALILLQAKYYRHRV